MFNQIVTEIRFDLRSDPADHLDLVPHPTDTPGPSTIHGDPSTIHDRTIAVLTRPGAWHNSLGHTKCNWEGS